VADDAVSPARSSEAEAATLAEEAANGDAATALSGKDGVAASAGATADNGAASPVQSAPGSPDPGGSPPPAYSGTHLLAAQQRSGSKPTLGRMQRDKPVDLEQARHDAELEVCSAPRRL
jgi:hypothetical protein